MNEYRICSTTSCRCCNGNGRTVRKHDRYNVSTSARNNQLRNDGALPGKRGKRLRSTGDTGVDADDDDVAAAALVFVRIDNSVSDDNDGEMYTRCNEP